MYEQSDEEWMQHEVDSFRIRIAEVEPQEEDEQE